MSTNSTRLLGSAPCAEQPFWSKHGYPLYTTTFHTWWKLSVSRNKIDLWHASRYFRILTWCREPIAQICMFKPMKTTRTSNLHAVANFLLHTIKISISIIFTLFKVCILPLTNVTDNERDYCDQYDFIRLANIWRWYHWPYLCHVFNCFCFCCVPSVRWKPVYQADKKYW